jgi:hypothetical protein
MTLITNILYYNIRNKGFIGDRNDEWYKKKDQPNFVRLEERWVAEFIFNWGITSDDSKSWRSCWVLK